MLRLPAAKVGRAALAPYFVGSNATRLAKRGAHLVLDLVNEPDDPEYDDDDEDEVSLAAVSGVRAELLRGDLRPAFLAWVLSVRAGEVDEGETEPPVPAGLGELTPSQCALASFLRIDHDLLAAASRGASSKRDDRKAFQAWVGALSERDKEAWLMRAAEDPGLALGSEMLRVFRAQAKKDASMGWRTVAGLLALAEEERTQRERRDAARADRARRAGAAARERRLSKLARDLESAWGGALRGSSRRGGTTRGSSSRSTSALSRLAHQGMREPSQRASRRFGNARRAGAASSIDGSGRCSYLLPSPILSSWLTFTVGAQSRATRARA